MKTVSPKTSQPFNFLFILLLLFPQPISQYALGAEDSEKENTRKARDLIEKLGNKDVLIKNRDSSDPYLVIPKTFEWKYQGEVNKNVDKLIKMGLDAFPESIAHFDDDRFCGFRVVEVDSPVHVGTVCSDIIECQICVFSYDCHDKEMWHWQPHPLEEDESGEFTEFDAKKWWKENKSKSLCELQIDAAKKSIKILKNLKKNDDDFWRHDRRKEFDSWRTEQIKGLEKMIKKLRKTNKPEPAIGIFDVKTISEKAVKKVGNENRVYFSNGK